MWSIIDAKTIISALIVAAIVSGIGIWGNSRLLDYKFDQLAQEIGSLKTAKVDKVLVDRLNTEIVILRAEKADRAIVEVKLGELQRAIVEIQGDLKYLVRLQVENKRKGQ